MAVTSEKREIHLGLTPIFSPDYPFDVNLLTEKITADNLENVNMFSGAVDSRFCFDPSGKPKNEAFVDFWASNHYDPETIIFTNPFTWIHFGLTEDFFRKQYPALYSLVSLDFWVLAESILEKLSHSIPEDKSFKYTFSGRNPTVYSRGARYSLLTSMVYSLSFIAGVAKGIGLKSNTQESISDLLEIAIEKAEFSVDNGFDGRERVAYDAEGSVDLKEMAPHRFVEFLGRFRDGENVFYSSALECLFGMVTEQYREERYHLEVVGKEGNSGLQPRFSSVSTSDVSYWSSLALDEFARFCTPKGARKEEDSKHSRAATFSDRMKILRINNSWYPGEADSNTDLSTPIIRDVKGFLKYLTIFYKLLSSSCETVRIQLPEDFTDRIINVGDLGFLRAVNGFTAKHEAVLKSGESDILRQLEAELINLEEEEEPTFIKFVKSLEIRDDYEVRQEIAIGRREAMRACIFRVEPARVPKFQERKLLINLGFSKFNAAEFKREGYLSQNMLYNVILRMKGNQTLIDVKKVMKKFRRGEFSSKQAGQAVLDLLK